jgi:hypothetical protein
MKHLFKMLFFACGSAWSPFILQLEALAGHLERSAPEIVEHVGEV